MRLDQEKKKKLAHLLLEGHPWEHIQRELEVSLDDITEAVQEIWTKEQIKLELKRGQKQRLVFFLGRGMSFQVK